MRGPAAVTAGDLQTPADVEVLNPELHIATLNAKGRLAMDVTVERGRGYVSAERNKRSSTIGVIPVDSIFSPVRRVAFTIEPTRVEQSTNFDRLVLDIETDGSISPREALASAGDTLRSLVGLVADMSDHPQGLELGDVGSDDQRLARPRPAHRGPRPLRAAPQLPEAGAGQHASASWSSAPRTTCWPSPTSARSPSTRSSSKLDERGLSLRVKEELRCRAPRRKGRRFGGDAAHQKAMLGNLVASLVAAEALVTTEAKAKAMRPVVEKVITKARKGGVHNQRQVVAFIRDKDMANKLFEEIGPRYVRPPWRLHPHPQARAPPWGQRPHGPHRARLTLFGPDEAAGPSEPGGGVRVRLTVAYDGTGFRGFAAQPGQTTVGGTLAEAIEKVVGHPVSLTCAADRRRGPRLGPGGPRRPAPARGRLDLDALVRSCNAMLAPAIVVREAAVAPVGFDARRSAVSRRYRYSVLNRRHPDPFLATTAWHVEDPLDLRAMELASDPLLGEHDFSTFCRRPPDGGSLVRRVLDARWTRGHGGLGEGDLLRFEIVAAAFCHQMVRSVVGTLVEVGRGRKRAGDLAWVLRSGDRALAGSPAPPHGLCLWAVTYPEDGASPR